jgi:hypothetical protein
MLLLAARFACIGIRLLRASNPRASLTLATNVLKPFSPILRPTLGAAEGFVKSGLKHLSKINFRASPKSLVSYKANVAKHLELAASELAMPKALQPKVFIGKLPWHFRGAYLPKKHLIVINKRYHFLDKFFPWLSKEVVRHELKHADQFLEIARRGGAAQLTGSSSLPKKLAIVANSKFPLPVNNERLAFRLKQVNDSIQVNRSNLKAQARVQRYIVGSGTKVLGDIFYPPLYISSKSCKFIASTSKPLERLEAVLSDSARLKSLEKGFRLRYGLCKRTHHRYLQDAFETEARTFQANYGFTKFFSRVF